MNGNGWAGSTRQRRQDREHRAARRTAVSCAPLAGLELVPAQRSPARAGAGPAAAPRSRRRCCSATSGRTAASIVASCWRGVRPSGDSSRTLQASCCFRPPTRFMKNSSRLESKMATNFSRSSSGFAGPRPRPAPGVELQPGQLAVEEQRGVLRRRARGCERSRVRVRPWLDFVDGQRSSGILTTAAFGGATRVTASLRLRATDRHAASMALRWRLVRDAGQNGDGSARRTSARAEDRRPPMSAGARRRAPGGDRHRLELHPHGGRRACAPAAATACSTASATWCAWDAAASAAGALSEGAMRRRPGGAAKMTTLARLKGADAHSGGGDQRRARSRPTATISSPGSGPGPGSRFAAPRPASRRAG